MEWLAPILQTWLLVSISLFGLIMSALIVGARADRRCHDDADAQIAPSDGDGSSYQAYASA